MQTCVHCGAENPDENGYCDRCHGLLEPLERPAPPPLGSSHPYLVWERWPWARFQTITQSQDQFIASMAVQAIGAVLVLVAVTIAMGVRFGPLAAGVATAIVMAFIVAGNFVRWKAGRRGARWYSRDSR